METRSSRKLLKNEHGGRVDLLGSTRSQVLIAVLLVVLIFAARLLPHAANFTPVAAVGLFAGIYLRKSWALYLPLAGLILSDIFLAGYSMQGRIVVYGMFFLTGILGRILSRGGVFSEQGRLANKSVRVGGGAIIGAVLFFLITNNVFVYMPAISLYPMTFDGMINSYIMAIPFFRSQILGDLFYSGLLFGAYEFARVWSARWVLRSVES
jgi:hypothetical protein